jgi:hypothetical protein
MLVLISYLANVDFSLTQPKWVNELCANILVRESTYFFLMYIADFGIPTPLTGAILSPYVESRVIP